MLIRERAREISSNVRSEVLCKVDLVLRTLGNVFKGFQKKVIQIPAVEIALRTQENYWIVIEPR